MKIFKSQVVTLLFAGLWNDISSAQVQSLSVPVDVQFINKGSSRVNGQFSVRAGQIFLIDETGVEKPSSLGHLDGPKEAGFTGLAETILGAPAVVLARQEVTIPYQLLQPEGSAVVEAVVLPEATVFVQETRTTSTESSPSHERQVITGFAVSQLMNDKLTTLGKFSFHENTYNQYLTEVWPISDAVLAIVTKSSRHSRLNTLFMFDMNQHQLVGMKEFSLLQYIPSTSSVWMTQSVANCDNIEEIFAEAKSKAQTFQLFVDGGIAHDFQTLDGIDGDVAK